MMIKSFTATFLLQHVLHWYKNKYLQMGARIAVYIVARLQAGWSRVKIAARARDFLFPKVSRPALGPTQPPDWQVLGVLSPNVRWPWHEVDQSPPSRAEVMNEWTYISTPPYAYMTLLQFLYVSGQKCLQICNRPVPCIMMRVYIFSVCGILANLE
jgi:hypothetical protein